MESTNQIEAFREEISVLEDINELNRKRGTKKSSITTAQTFLEKVYPNPENWKIADLTKKYDGLTTACNHYIIVAEHIATIQDLEFDADYAPQVAENTAVQFAFEENQSVYKAYLHYVDLFECLESIHSQSSVTGLATIKAFDSLSNSIEKFKKDTVALRSVKQVQSWRNKIEELTMRIRLRMDDTQDKDSPSPLAVIVPTCDVKYHSTLKWIFQNLTEAL